MSEVTTAPALDILAPENLAKREIVRSFCQRSSKEIVKIPFDRIRLMPGWNERINFGDLEELADQIDAAGLDLPIAVDITVEGLAYISDGERRYKAIEILRQRDEKYLELFSSIEATINPKGTTNIQRKLQQLTRNSGKAFEPIEEAKVYAYLVEQDMTPADIARLTGKSKMHVSNRLRLAGISDVEKEAIVEGTISPTAAVDLIKEGLTEEQRIERINEAKEKGEKVKVKDIKPTTPSTSFTFKIQQRDSAGAPGEIVGVIIIPKSHNRENLMHDIFGRRAYVKEVPHLAVDIISMKEVTLDGELTWLIGLEPINGEAILLHQLPEYTFLMDTTRPAREVNPPASKPSYTIGSEPDPASDDDDDTFSDENNSKADDDELQARGQGNTSPNKKLKSPTLVDLMSEIILMQTGLENLIASIGGDEAVKAATMQGKIIKKMKDAKQIAVHL